MMKNKVVSFQKKLEALELKKLERILKLQQQDCIFTMSITQGVAGLDEVLYFGKSFHVPVECLPQGLEEVQEKALRELTKDVEIHDRKYSPARSQSGIVINYSAIEIYLTADIDRMGVTVLVRVPYEEKKGWRKYHGTTTN